MCSLQIVRFIVNMGNGLVMRTAQSGVVQQYTVNICSAVNICSTVNIVQCSPVDMCSKINMCNKIVLQYKSHLKKSSYVQYTIHK